MRNLDGDVQPGTKLESSLSILHFPPRIFNQPTDTAMSTLETSYPLFSSCPVLPSFSVSIFILNSQRKNSMVIKRTSYLSELQNHQQGLLSKE
ncbi:hypothetical protein CEXT_489091 [Caerostris extrusa]|uniref:Uncharacterized protein n=1 Tax=Caerostris extrusa TaxID=172846 RepID=A0AAV4PSU8_CAEEX|nr:hypothetical protein CEXT_489091 [Caerostris extrusa]